jgi:hypothetical protein
MEVGRVGVFMHLRPLRILLVTEQTNKQTVKVWQPLRAARSNSPNTPFDGIKTSGKYCRCAASVN